MEQQGCAALLALLCPGQWQCWHSPSPEPWPCPNAAQQSELGPHEHCRSLSRISELLGDCIRLTQAGNSPAHSFRSSDNVSFPSQERESGCSAQFLRNRAAPLTTSKCLLFEKSNLSCWLLQRNFLQASNLSLVQTVNLLSPRLLRSWIYTFLESSALETRSVHKKLAQVAFCFPFLLHFSEEILTKLFTIFRMLMAVKLRQKRDLLLHWQNVSGRNQLWLVLHVIS